MSHSFATRFAPAERSPIELLRRQTGYFSEASITRHLLDAIPTLLLILNEQRQIVYGNRTLLDLVGVRGEEYIFGLRPGEVLRCVNADLEPGGCGTSESCRSCGMAASILAGLAGKKEIRECRFLRNGSDGATEAIDLMVWATPLHFQGDAFTIFALSDISHEKRRLALERIFFHDVLNVIGSIKGFAELLRQYDPPDRRDIYEMIFAGAEQTIEEIEAQRTLSAAESKELKVRPFPLSVVMFLQQSVDLYRRHWESRNLTLKIAEPVPDLFMVTDRTLLGRIFGNMIKNALEASRAGETVTVGSRQGGDTIEFWVHNTGVIPADVQLEIFQRSFSTKGKGRGLGTYSMKILSEYLQGEVSFTSTEKEGTLFRAKFPLSSL